MPPIQFLVERRENGKTVADVLRRRFQLTWSQAKRLVENGHVRVAGQLTRAPEQRVKTGNRMWISAGAIENPSADGTAKPPRPKKADPAKPKPPAAKAKKPPVPVNVVPLEIVYSDDAVVVVNKPIGLTTSRSKDEREEFGRGKKYLPTTLAELLPAALGTPNRPVFAVHRLDRDTSGLIVFARTPAAARHLTGQFRKRTVDRRYLAVTRGVPSDGRIESRLVDDRGDGRRGSGEGTDSQRAVTHVRVLERLGAFALVECKLDTGRTHQVRIHLGEAGTPLCGERVYDRPPNGQPVADDSGAARPLLHAVRLGIEHPDNDEFMGWEADPPADFATVLAKMRSETGGAAE
jgi:23S rRNA pseudouridine1911/1915/1917 synthase